MSRMLVKLLVYHVLDVVGFRVQGVLVTIEMLVTAL